MDKSPTLLKKMRNTSLKLLKKSNYRKKNSKHDERNIYKCTEVFNFA